MMKFVNLLLALMFMAFAFVQYNDPDPVAWILIYGSMAVVCVMAAFDYYVRKLMLVQGVVYLGYASTLAGSLMTWLRSPDKGMIFDEIAKMNNLYIEETRECLGLVICLVVLAVCWARSRSAIAS